MTFFVSVSKGFFWDGHSCNELIELKYPDNTYNFGLNYLDAYRNSLKASK